MQRRKFLKGAAAVAATPAMPFKLAASPLPVPKALYDKAVYWAGLFVHSTPATYKNILNVDAATGRAVFERLQSDGILGAANEIGLARAAIPRYEMPEVAARLQRTMKPAKPRGPYAAQVKTTPENPGPDELRRVLDGDEPSQEPVVAEENPDPLATAERPQPRPDQSVEV